MEYAGAAASTGVNADAVSDIEGFARVGFLDDGDALAAVEADFDLNALLGAC